ncbi:Ester hydrolase C11orf54 [Amphibalanus amphitrite]|uniref:Ester hydrolase C11orf54 n=1 Tax=Amphibalanus amphitrite TaxID=1232801 RepID=A0A6A4VC80_AMPAM|nr:Ester hydrolase C11orf54 [Amphibalanus amphitrite]
MATTLDMEQLTVKCQSLYQPPQIELAVVLQSALRKNFADATVRVVDCPDLTQRPFNLAAPDPCVTRYGNFPVSHNSQKFFRCRGNIVTLEDCGNSYIFDPDVRYCVLRKKEARFWWVSDIPSELHWRSPGYVVTLQDCLMLCHDRFVIVGTSLYFRSYDFDLDFFDLDCCD